MKFKSLVGLAGLVTMGFASQANANLISTTVNLTAGSGSVQYVNFNVTDAGNFAISAFGSATNGSTYNFDPEIYLFSSPVGFFNYLDHDNDSGTGSNAYISHYLSLGSYVLAVSESSFSYFEALGGSNSLDDPGLVGITINGGNYAAAQFGNTVGNTAPPTSVPEPASLALFGLGLAGVGVMRRKQVKA